MKCNGKKQPVFLIVVVQNQNPYWVPVISVTAEKKCLKKRVFRAHTEEEENTNGIFEINTI